MGAPYTGRCQCGAVTAKISGEPLGVRQCWCRQCQQLAGGSSSTNAMFLDEHIALSGELGCHTYVADSGAVFTQSFCAACGTPICGQSSARMHMRSLRLGFLDKGHGLRPTAAIWLDDAPDWAVIDPAMEQFARQPPMPPTS